MVQRYPNCVDNTRQQWNGQWMNHAQQLAPGKPWPTPCPDDDQGLEPYQALTTRSYLNGATNSKALLLTLPVHKPSRHWLPGQLPTQQASLAITKHKAERKDLWQFAKAHVQTISTSLGVKAHHLLDPWESDPGSKNKQRPSLRPHAASTSEAGINLGRASSSAGAADTAGCHCNPCWARGTFRASTSQQLQDTSALMRNDDYRRALLAGDADALLSVSSDILQGAWQPRPSQLLASIQPRHSCVEHGHVPSRHAVQAAVRAKLWRPANQCRRGGSAHPEAGALHRLMDGSTAGDGSTNCDMRAGWQRRWRQQQAPPMWPSLRSVPWGARLLLAPWANSTTTEPEATAKSPGFQDVTRRARVRNLQRNMQPYIAWAKVLTTNHRLHKQQELQELGLEQANYNLHHALMVQRTSSSAVAASKRWQVQCTRRRQAAEYIPVAGVLPRYYDHPSNSCSQKTGKGIKAKGMAAGEDKLVPWRKLRQYVHHSSGSNSSDSSFVRAARGIVHQDLSIGNHVFKQRAFNQRADQLLAERAHARRQPRLRRPRPSSSEEERHPVNSGAQQLVAAECMRAA